MFSSAITRFETIKLIQIQNCRVDLCHMNQREEHNKPLIILTCGYSLSVLSELSVLK